MFCDLPPAELRRIARHEAGHTLVAVALGIPVVCVTIDGNRGRTSTLSVPAAPLDPRAAPDSQAVRAQQNALCFTVAGCIADNGELVSAQAQRLLLETGKDFVCDLDLPIPAGDYPDLPLAVQRAVVLGDYQQARRTLSGLDLPMALLLWAERRAARILRPNGPALEAVAEALVKRVHHSLTTSDVRGLLGLR